MAASDPPVESRIVANNEDLPRLEPEDELPAETDLVYRELPRFRLLLVGNSGVGKSSLINRAFNVHDAVVSEREPGQCDIDREISSSSNPRIVVHDSQGFEAGEDVNFEIVENFIKTRQSRDRSSEKIHAVWLCILIPTAGGAVVERGTERILALCRDLQVPVIVVFTKFDLLVDKARYELRRKGWTGTDQKCNEKAEKQAATRYDSDCIKVLKNSGPRGEMFPVVKISVKEGYANTIVELIRITGDTIAGKPLAEVSNARQGMRSRLPGAISALLPQPKRSDDPLLDMLNESVLLGTCQAVDRELKVNISIKIGQRNYWRGLADNKTIPKLPFVSFLKTIHKDVVSIWNFPGSADDDSYIRSIDFVDSVTRLSDGGTANNVRVHVTNIGLASGIAGIAAAAAPVVAPIVAPVVFVVIFLLAWAVEAYRETPETVRRMMAYIVDLINIMRGVFDAIPYADRSQNVERGTVEDAIKKYSELEWKKELHAKIEAFSKGPDVLKKDRMVNMIIKLIKQYDY